MSSATPSAIQAGVQTPSRLAAHTSAAVTLRAMLMLTKPRLAAMSVLTTALAHLVAAQDGGKTSLAILVAGTALSAAGALALNQWRERDTDAIMERTRGRPLPAQQLAPAFALGWSLALATAGVAMLASMVNAMAGALAAATIVIYAWIYTPLKRTTRWATEIGAISGALPPLIGWAAAGGSLTAFAWLIFAILYLWQMPHFFAIGWLCRTDYRAAGFPLLPAIDSRGERTAAWSLAYCLLLLPVSLLPVVLGFAGWLFGTAAGAGGAIMVWRAWRMLRDDQDRDTAARRLFMASIAHLPLVLAALALDRLL